MLLWKVDFEAGYSVCFLPLCIVRFYGFTTQLFRLFLLGLILNKLLMEIQEMTATLIKQTNK